ncbi:MAG: hypothetical protein JJD92_07115 [Frankiaceae bacterium]|nr:hypothetical protein [Frankiaceae bacterium]
MNAIIKTWWARTAVGGAVALAATLGTTGTAAAANSGTLTVNLPCGCVLFEDDFPTGTGGGLPVGHAAHTPAAENHGAATFTP